jgi:hypothetical protein
MSHQSNSHAVAHAPRTTNADRIKPCSRVLGFRISSGMAVAWPLDAGAVGAPVF